VFDCFYRSDKCFCFHVTLSARHSHFVCRTQSLCLPDTVTLCAGHSHFVCRTQSLCLPDTVTLSVRHCRFVCRTQSLCLPDTVTLCAGHSHFVCQTHSLVQGSYLFQYHRSGADNKDKLFPQTASISSRSLSREAASLL